MNEQDEFSISAGFTVTDEDQDSDSDVITIDVGDDGGGGGGNGDEILYPDENGILVGTPGDDEMQGEPGVTIFQWNFGDQGDTQDPRVDLINDFDTGGPGAGGDALDLSDLLVGEDESSLTDFLYFELNAQGDTVLRISTNGGFSGGYDPSAVEQSIVIDEVDLVTAFTDVNDVVDQSALIQSLLNNGSLITD